VKTFSEELREAREAKGLTLEELAISTKINLKILKALESGDYEVLPQTYIKGFLRIYAREVGVDATAIVNAYTAQKKAASEIFLHPLKMEKRPPKRPTWLVIGGLVGICLILCAGFYFLSGVSWERKSSQRTMIEENSSLTSDEIVPLQLEAEFTDTVQPVATMKEAEEDTEEITPSGEATGFPAVFSEPEPGKSQDDHEEMIFDESTGLLLGIEAVSDTWMRVLADGIAVYEGILRVHASATWEADSLFELKIGKAAGVRLLLNNRPLGDLGPPDRVVSELILNRHGIVKKTLR
jgi:cytoskeleton protein RodZ